MSTSHEVRRVLGLDIGVASVGWSVLEYDGEQATRILGSGSRIFSPGVDGDIKTGKDEAKNQKRQQARQARRQLWRRQRRLLKLLRTLVRFGLLPTPTSYEPDAIDQSLKGLDRALMSTDSLMSDRRGAQVFHYRLRARAASGAVSAHELGRALYHLAQHRGYLSNRKAMKKEGEDDGEVATGISELKEKILASGLPTLGAYFASIDPETERIRDRWLGRNEFIVPEFDAIQQMQSTHHKAIATADWEEIKDAIFRQRPLRDQSHLIGKCSLEPTERRCLVAYPLAQRFRILQAVNHLRVAEMDGEIQRTVRPLTANQRQLLIEALMVTSDLTWPQLKKVLGEQTKGIRFSLELSGEKKIIGNRTAASMRVAMGAKWDEFSDEDQQQIVDDLIEYESGDALAKRLTQRWKIPADDAKGIAASEHLLERARLNFSRRAIRNLLPHLETGLSVAEARVRAYPAQAGVDTPWELLPPIKPDRIWQKHCSDGRPYRGIEIRNPAVERSLGEVRKVVNAIIRRWGKPDQVRIELARDLKKPRKEREDESKRMREQAGRREDALANMVKEGFDHIAARRGRSDVDKMLLWQECSGVCPYTGKSISLEALFGPTPRFEVEHIIPYSLSLEDGFGNKTLCEIAENRSLKRNLSPFDAYHGGSKWDAIMTRVKLFKGRSAAKKLRLFLSEKNGHEVFGDFATRQLNDTRYASRLAADYLGLLFGGRVDESRTQRVTVSAGGATAQVRRKLGLEGILGGGVEKNRSDHRHHAIDAIAIALTGPSEVQAIARASAAAIARGEASHRLKLELPWESFAADVKRSIDGIVVSHRVDRRLSGPLHLETNYSRPIKNARGESSATGPRHLRCRLDALASKDVESIVDPRVRQAVIAHLAALGNPDPKKAFKGGENLPMMRHGDGREVVIRKVRVTENKTLVAVGRGGSKRYVAPGSNHHMTVVDVLGVDGKVLKREFEIVTLFEAKRRKACGEPVIRMISEANRVFAFSLRSGDVVDFEFDGVRTKRVVRTVSRGDCWFTSHTDARPSGDVKKSGRSGGLVRLSDSNPAWLTMTKIDQRPLGDGIVAHE